MESTREDDSPSDMMLINSTLPTQSFLIESDDDEFLRRSDSRLSDVSTSSSKSEFPLASSEPTSPKQRDNKRQSSRKLANSNSNNLRTSFRQIPSSLISDIIGKMDDNNNASPMTRSKSQDFKGMVMKDRHLAIKVFEMRNIPDKKTRDKLKKQSTSLLKKTQSFLSEISSPNLMVVDKVNLDGYIKVSVNKHKFRTRTIYRKLNPFWAEEFCCDISKPDKTIIKVVLMDENKFSDPEAIGKLFIPVSAFKTEASATEQWYPLFPMSSKDFILEKNHVIGGHKAIFADGITNPGLGEVRIKLKYTEEVVLPLMFYESSGLIKLFVEDENLTLVKLLGRVTSEREAVASICIKIFQHFNKVLWFINSLTSAEIDSTNNPDIIFRGNSIVTKVVDVYMKFVGMNYLKVTLQQKIRQLYASKEVCEINPSKLEKGEDPKKNIKLLIRWVKAFGKKIFSSVDDCPRELQEIFSHLQNKVKTKYSEDQVRITKYTAVSGFLFLRLLCPAILGPKLFYIMDRHPDVNTNRSLILIAKTLQNVANLVEFGNGKEDYMTPLNEWVQPKLETMKNFIDSVATPPPENKPVTPVAHVFVEKELASISRYLRVEMKNMVAEAATDDEKAALSELEQVLQKIERAETRTSEKIVKE